MISKISKMRNSIFTKIILTITALSFMSLFGVSGYITTANSNKAVVKVDDFEISQSEFSYMLQRDISRLKALGAIDIDEDGGKKAQIANTLLKAKLDDLILENTMKKYNIDITENLVRQILLLMPQFQNNGKFDYEAYKWFLNRSGKTEAEMIQDIKRNVARKILLDSQVAYVNVPKVQLNQMAKVVGQRRTFRYIKIENDKANITREPTNEELDQYYDDMSEDLMLPETRDLTVLYLPQEKLTSEIEITPEEIESYYKEHIDEFEQGEQRSVMQMVFDSEEKADAAYASLLEGRDFAKVAEENGQNPDEINLGFVSANDVSEELSQIIFTLDAGKYSEPQKIADSWQILQVNDIKVANKVNRSEVNTKITDELRQDRAYDNNSDVIAALEDKLGAGTALTEIAASYNENLHKVKGLDEEGNVKYADEILKSVISNKDFLDTAFSYNEGETGQAVETDDGIAVVMIDKITETHQLPREEAQDRLKAMWLENERASVTQETVDNIEHDLEAGDDLSDIASRYNLQVINSRPATRNETIDKVSFVEMKKLFASAKNEPQTIKIGDDYIVAETTNIYDDSASIQDDKKELLKQTIYEENAKEMADALLKDFSSDYKIKVNYNHVDTGD
ncbi:MAG: SurA N-terminal domain-containing protein [Alphaproteobacteria bacterium]|nr:SurA N-terminal domain-containing protein [Alphaproteobacteria bacterium]